MQLALGWMMCILAGDSFRAFPLIYDVEGFEKTLMRVYVGMNVFGQIAIAAGILTADVSLFYSLGNDWNDLAMCLIGLLVVSCYDHLQKQTWRC